MSKNLKYFMREAAEVERVVTVPAPESFKDENGKVIQLEVKVLSSERIRAINEAYHTHAVALDKKGNPYINGGNVVFRDERDNAKATRHILVEALQYPKLDDPELMKYYNCVDITQMPEKVFSRADEFAHVTRVVMALLGIGGQLSEEEQKQADEKEIDDAKTDSQRGQRDVLGPCSLAAARPPTGGVRPNEPETEALLHRLRGGGKRAPVQKRYHEARPYKAIGGPTWQH